MISAAQNALEDIIPADMYALDFKKEHYDRLLATLQNSYKKEELQQKKGAIKKAIVEYFAQTLQCVTFSVHEDSVGVKKIFAYDKKDEDFDRVIHAVNSILIPASDDPGRYKHLPYMWVLPEEMRSELFGKFDSQKETSAAIRDYLRQQIQSVFETTQKDITLFLRSRIYIRCFYPPKKFPPGTDKRFSGESLEDMESMFKTNFPNGIWDEILDYLPDVMEDSLNFSEIDNATFSRTYVSVLRSMIEIILLDTLGEMETERIEGFAGYVLRIYFDKILRYVAQNLLEHVESRDKNAELFVKYYVDEVVLDANGNKVQKHAIVDTKQQTWNYTAILSVLMQWQQVLKRVAAQEEKIQLNAGRLKEAKDEFHTERVNKEAVDKVLLEARDVLTKQNARMQSTRLEGLNAKEQKALQEKMEAERVFLDEKVQEAAREVEYANRRCKNKKTEVFSWEKQLASSKKQLEEIHEQGESVKSMYDLIINALVAVFVRR